MFLIVIVMDKSSVEVNSEEYVTLCCKEATAKAPSSGVIWMKDGIEINHLVRTFCTILVCSCKFVVKQATNHNGDLLLCNVNEESSGYYQCINPVDNTTLLAYHVIVNTNTNLTGKTLYTLIEHS